MARGDFFWIAIALGAVLLLSAGGVAVYDWETRLTAEEMGNYRKWAPVIAQAERANGLPAGLLARQALKESAYRTKYIDGTSSSSAGALGILQLEPAYFVSVRAATPFTDADTTAQIAQAAAEDARLYREFGSWPLALAAYDWGSGDLQSWINSGGQYPDTTGWPPETTDYVAQITADVPGAVV